MPDDTSEKTDRNDKSDSNLVNKQIDFEGNAGEDQTINVSEKGSSRGNNEAIAEKQTGKSSEYL